MTDVFSSLDRNQQNQALQDYINTLNSREMEKNKVARENADQDKKDQEYNSTVEGVTDPIAQELLRKPIENLAGDAIKGALNSFKARANRSLNSLGKKGIDAFKKSVLDKANELGVSPEKVNEAVKGITGKTSLGDAQDQIFKELQKNADPSKLVNSGTPAELDSETSDVVNSGRQATGRLPRPPADQVSAPPAEDGDVPRLIDPFTNQEIKPAEPTVSSSGDAPDEFDDWTHDLYDRPITQSGDLPIPAGNAPVEPAQAQASEAPTADDNPFSFSNFNRPPASEGSAQSRLSEIFKSSNLSDNAPSVDFTGRSSRVPQPRAPAPESVAGDTQPLDQLHPMRDLIRGRAEEGSLKPNFTDSDVADAMRTYRQTATDLPPVARPQRGVSQLNYGEVQPKVESGPTEEPTPSAPDSAPAPTPADDAGVGGAGDTRVAGTGAKTALEDAGEDALGEFGAIAGSEGGLNPIADVIGLVAGLGTLFGGLFGGHHHKDVAPPPSASVNPSYQPGVE